MATKAMTVIQQGSEDYTINDPNITNEFSSSAAYAVGDLVNYQGNLYRFTTAHPAGSWDASHVEQTTVDAEIKAINNNLDVYSGVYTLESGYRNVYGNLVTDAKRMTTNILHIDRPFTISVNKGYQVIYCVGNSSPYTDKGWVIVGGGSYHIGVNEGNTFFFNFARTDLADFSSVDDIGFRITIDGSDDMYSFEDCSIINGYMPFMSGYVNIYRNIVENSKRATTNVLHITKPFTIKIDSGWQVMYLVGGNSGNLTDKGWVIVGGGTYHIDLSEGTYFAFNFAKTSLDNIYPWRESAGFRIILDESNNYIFDHEISLIKESLSNANIKPTYVVDINGSGDYSSLLVALKSTPDNSHIVVMPGEYDMKAEYESYYGSNYFVNYSGYDLSDIYSRGYFIGYGRELDCQAGAVIKFRYEGENEHVGSHFSVLNTGMNATVRGCYIYYKGTKYAIHDDYALNESGCNTFENIIIEGVPSSVAGIHWGGGCGKKNTYYIRNVVFLDDELPSGYGDIYYHNSEYANAVNRIVVNNCFGDRSLFFIWMGQSEKISHVIVSGCEFDSISIRAINNEAPYENMKLHKYNNTETGE